MGTLIHRRTTVANINYHPVWATKRRRRVLVPDLAKDIEQWTMEVADECNCKVHKIEVGNRDHVHCLISAPPDVTVSDILHMIKGTLARRAFRKYAFLGRVYPKHHMWNPSTYIETIGCISEDVIRRYIDNQDQNGVTKRRSPYRKGGKHAKS